jgi:glycosyltransferase involved in cell wall biosynthesis
MKIKFLPYQPHCFAFGGFELQMLSAFDELQKNNIDVEKLNIWDRSSDFDILHCWGLGLGNYENLYWGKRANKKIVLTALLGYYENSLENLKYLISKYFYKHRILMEMVENIDMMVLINEIQAEVAIKYFKVNPSKVKIIPNIVNERFFNYGKTPIYNENGYILSVGNICGRKNQLNLAKSCIELNVQLVLIGKVLEGEEKYGNELDKLISQNKNIIWIKGLKENSDELFNYFLNCSAFALPSFKEQQPISLLEAAVLKKPLITSSRAYAKQKYYLNSKLINPNSIVSIKSGITEVLKNPKAFVPNMKPLEECHGINVAMSYMEIYKELLKN